MDQSILDYLSGKVSFSSWLESHAANLEFAEAILGPGQAPVIATNTATACTHQFSIATNAEADIRSGSVATAVQAFPSTPMIRGEQYGQMLDSASTGEQEKNELHASCPEPRSLLSGLSQEGDRPSRGSLLTIDPSSIQTDIPFSVLKPETQLREDGGEEVEEALNGGHLYN